MNQGLPANLLEAEKMFYSSVALYLDDTDIKGYRLAIKLKFEGLRIMPVCLRFAEKIKNKYLKVKLAFPDAGAGALAKRDCPTLSQDIFTFKQLLSEDSPISDEDIIVAVSPQNYDYQEYESLCNKHSGFIIMMNGRLEDPMVGIGSVARERRRGFVSSWQNIFWLEPLEKGALMRSYPDDWSLFRSEKDGYRLFKTYERKPQSEILIEELG